MSQRISSLEADSFLVGRKVSRETKPVRTNMCQLPEPSPPRWLVITKGRAAISRKLKQIFFFPEGNLQETEPATRQNGNYIRIKEWPESVGGRLPSREAHERPSPDALRPSGNQGIASGKCRRGNPSPKFPRRIPPLSRKPLREKSKSS